MPLPGILASSASKFAPSGAYDALATVTVGATSVSSIQFAGIPSGYKHLQIRFSALTARPTYGYDGLYFTFNNDATASYSGHNISANGSATPGSGGGGGASYCYMDFVLGTTVSSYPGSGIIDILDYANTNKNKTMRGLGGTDLNGTIAGVPGRLNYASSGWFSTSAISSIQFYPVNNNFTQNTQFALYGVK